MMQGTKIIIDVFEQLSPLSLSQMLFSNAVSKFEGPPHPTEAPYSEFVKGQSKNNPDSLSGLVPMTLVPNKEIFSLEKQYS